MNNIDKSWPTEITANLQAPYMKDLKKFLAKELKAGKKIYPHGKIFTKVIKEITVAVKTGGGPDADGNPRLRSAIQAARAANMPKDTVDRAIKKASGAGSENFSEVTYEGYGPDGVAIFVECATDNSTRTVSNVKSYFTKHGGSVGKDGCLQFVFDRKGIFTFKAGDYDEEEFSLEMIDAGASDVEFEEGNIIVTCEMQDFGNIQKALSERKIEITSSGLERIPSNYKEVKVETFQTILKLINVLEDDDDVQRVYHNVEFTEELANAFT